LKASFYLLGVVGLGLSACAYGSLRVDNSAPVEGDVPDGGLREAGGVGSRGESGASPPPEAGGPDAAVSRPPPPDDSGILDTGLPDQVSSRDAGLPDANLPDGGTSTCASHGYSGVLVTFDLSTQPGGEPSVPPASSAVGVTSGVLARATGLTAAGGSGSINSSGWAASASADPGKYYSFTVAPASGCTFTPASLSLDVSASATGPSTGDVATSADGFAQHAGVFAGTSSGQVPVAAGRSAQPLEIRVYGYSASGSSGTLRIQNTMSLSGSID
jgi:hypothetical protein